jgi:hypothetical protein
MKNIKQALQLFCLLAVLSTPKPTCAQCDTHPNLSAPIAEFDARQVSRVEALLRLGEKQGLCFGIEYVDKALLTELTDFHFHGTNVQRALRSILGREQLVAEVRDGVVEISQKTANPGAKNIFDKPIAEFQARRASVQDLSIALHMQLVTDLNPSTGGFVGHYSPGDLKDLVGPFAEYNRTVRYLLNQIVSQSKGGAWIARISWGLRGDFGIPEKRRIWTIIEYDMARANYPGLLSGIAADLESAADRKQARNIEKKPLFTPQFSRSLHNIFGIRDLQYLHSRQIYRKWQLQQLSTESDL